MKRRQRRSDRAGKCPGRDPGAELVENEIIEDQRRCFQILRASFDGDKEIQGYLDAMSEGYYKPAEISELTGISVDRVYQIHRKVLKYAQRFFRGAKFEDLQRTLSEGDAK